MRVFRAGLESKGHLKGLCGCPGVSHTFPASIVKELPWLVGFALATGWPLGAGLAHEVSVRVPFDGFKS